MLILPVLSAASSGSGGVCDGAPGNATPAPAAGGAGGNADNPGGAGQSVPGDSGSGVTEVSCTGGCTKSRSLLTWSASSLASGASVSHQATVKAAQPGKAVLLGAAASHNPDPHPLSNVAAAVITVKR